MLFEKCVLAYETSEMCTSFGEIRTMGPENDEQQIRGLVYTRLFAFLTILLMQLDNLPWKLGRLDQIVVDFIPECESRKSGTWD